MIKGNINIKAITNILIENERRNSIIYAKFNPITGEGSVGERVKCTISLYVYVAVRTFHFGQLHSFISRIKVVEKMYCSVLQDRNVAL